MSEASAASPTATEPSKSTSSAPPSPASTSTAKDSSSATKASTPSKASSSASASATTKSDSSKSSGGGLSSFKASLEKVKSATTTSNSSSDTAAAASAASSSSSSATDWTSRLTFGLASSKGKADLSEWLPDLSDKLPASLFTQPPLAADGQPTQPALPADAVTAEFPNFTSLLPPPPPPSSALRFGWIDEYGDYHPAAVNASAAGKLNVKLLKAREQAKELIASVMSAQEKAEKDQAPHSPRMSHVVKERLSIEGEKKDSRGQGVERLVQVIEGNKGEKKVVVTEEEKVPEDL